VIVEPPFASQGKPSVPVMVMEVVPVMDWLEHPGVPHGHVAFVQILLLL
jgi:hypothetical protein